MSLLDQLLPGVAGDPSPLARMLPADLPAPVVTAAAGIVVEQGVAFVPVPGPRGEPGPVGDFQDTDLVLYYALAKL